jgi:hypothetical protein
LAAAVPADDSYRNDTPRSLITAASSILRAVMDEPDRERNGTAALDLLAADALITYAVEAAADDCERFAALTDEMIARLSAVAAGAQGISK